MGLVHGTTPTRVQKNRAVYRLAAMGFPAMTYTRAEKLVTMIAEALGVPLPETMAERNQMIVRFSQQPAKITHDIAPREFRPLQISKPMLEAMARAHAYHEPLSLPEKLALEAKR